MTDTLFSMLFLLAQCFVPHKNGLRNLFRLLQSIGLVLKLWIKITLNLSQRAFGDRFFYSAYNWEFCNAAEVWQLQDSKNVQRCLLILHISKYMKDRFKFACIA